MSIESAKAFLKKYTSDENLRKKIEGASSDEERQKIVKEAGFEFTKDEIKQVVGSSTELSDSDLEKVAGGSGSSASESVAAGGTLAVVAAF